MIPNWPKTDSRSQDLKLELYRDFGFDRTAHMVTLHAADSCAFKITLDTLQEGGYMRQQGPERPVPVLEVCFVETALLKDTDSEGSVSREGSISPKPDPDLECYIRVGRRPADDDDEEPKTEMLVVARIQTINKQLAFTWLAVPTWRFNGLRVGYHEIGTRIPEVKALANPVPAEAPKKLQPDPYYHAWGVTSVKAIKEHLRKLVKSAQPLETVDETRDEEEAEKERNVASGASKADFMKKNEPWSSAERLEAFWGAAADVDAKTRWPHPWPLPTRPPREPVKISARHPDMHPATPRHTFDVEAVAVFQNVIGDPSIELDPSYESHLHVTFEAGKPLADVRNFFMTGDENWPGLAANKTLQKYQWWVGIWVLPQKLGCSEMYPWSLHYESPASEFCDPEAMAAEGGKPKLFVEVRIFEVKPFEYGQARSRDDIIDPDLLAYFAEE